MAQPQPKVYRYGRDINTDLILPARYMMFNEPEDLAKHCMEDLDGDFLPTVRYGDVVVGEENFGSGSSREHAPMALKASGIVAVIASSFARIFFRNAINIGLPVLETAGSGGRFPPRRHHLARHRAGCRQEHALRPHLPGHAPTRRKSWTSSAPAG